MPRLGEDLSFSNRSERSSAGSINSGDVDDHSAERYAFVDASPYVVSRGSLGNCKACFQKKDRKYETVYNVISKYGQFTLFVMCHGYCSPRLGKLAVTYMIDLK